MIGCLPLGCLWSGLLWAALAALLALGCSASAALPNLRPALGAQPSSVVSPLAPAHPSVQQRAPGGPSPRITCTSRVQPSVQTRYNPMYNASSQSIRHEAIPVAYEVLPLRLLLAPPPSSSLFLLLLPPPSSSLGSLACGKTGERRCEALFHTQRTWNPTD